MTGCNPRKGDDKGDHPPITPQRMATESEVGGEAYRVYDYIVSHFLASLMKDYKYEQTEVKISLGGEEFYFSSNREIRKGFTIALSSSKDSQNPLPELKRGESMDVDEIKLGYCLINIFRSIIISNYVITLKRRKIHWTTRLFD